MLLHWPKTLMNNGLRKHFGSELRVTFCSNTIKLELLKINFWDELRHRSIKQQIISLDEEPRNTVSPKLLEKLAHTLREPTWHHAAPVAVFSNALVRYTVLAWNAEITSKQERSVYLQHGFLQNYGDVSRHWLLCEHIAGYGKASLGSGIDQTLFKQIETVFDEAGIPLKAAHPLLMLASNQAFGYIKQNKLADTFWIACEENQRLVLALVKNGDWQMVRNVAMELDKEAQLHSLIQREELLSEVESDLPVLMYVEDKVCLFEDVKHVRSSLRTSQHRKHEAYKNSGRIIIKSVYLDYTKRVKTSLSSWLMFGSGVLLVVVMWMFFQQAQSRNTELQNKLALSDEPIIAPIVYDSPQIKKDIEAVNTAIQDIVIPWAALWKALETANVDGVNMLTLEPNAKTHLVRLNLVALNHTAMWAYLHNLNQKVALSDVRLISSEVTDVNGHNAVAFLVEATWSI